MNKSDLVDALADATGMTKADAARAVDAMFSPDDGVFNSAPIWLIMSQTWPKAGIDRLL